MRKLKKWLLISGSLFLAGVLGIILFFFLVKWEVFGPLPSEKDLLEIKNATATVVYSSDKKLVGKIFAENRTNVGYDSLPAHLINALIATEDARFWEHEGVDRRSLLRVLFKSILLGDRSSGGGSTITQQLAKNLFGRKEFGFMSLPVNKFKEIILAGRLEEIYPKEHIIELYFNTVPFSENVYGIEVASSRFFGKKTSDLKPQESAVLVGMLKANTYYNPRLHPDNAMLRRNTVISQMERYGYLSEQESDSLKTLPLVLHYREAEDRFTGYFMTRVREQAEQVLANLEKTEGLKYDLEKDGLQIYSTLNMDMQAYAGEAVRKHMKNLQKNFNAHWSGRNPWGRHPELFEAELKKSISYRNLARRKLSKDSMDYYLGLKHPVQVYSPDGDTVLNMSIIDSVNYYIALLNCGFFAMDPNSGAVLSWIGGLNHQLLPYDHVLSKRQAASTFKPILYAAALENGVDPCDYIPNEWRVYEEYDDWAPRNYSENYGGYYSMKGALKNSINVAAVQTIFKTGIENVIYQANRMGIDSHLPEDPSIALGTGSVSLYDMVKAYSVFASGGYTVAPFCIEQITDSRGKVLYEHKGVRGGRALDKEVTEVMNLMLQAVVNEGTGTRLRTVYGLRNELAGKTGTAQNYTDGWFIGYNPQIVAGVWVGASSPVVHFRTGTYGSGSAMALPVFGSFFTSVSRDKDLKKYAIARFPQPSEEALSRVDCPDFREENLLDSFFEIFTDNKGKKLKYHPDRDTVKGKKKEKKGFFQRIFGKKK